MDLLRLLAVLSLAIPSAVSAQFDTTSFEVHGGYYAWSGDNVAGLEPGWRIQAAAIGDLTTSVSVGATALYGRSGVDGVDANVGEVGVGGLARLWLGSPEGTRAFVDANVGWSLLRVSPGGSPIPTVSESGLALGPSVGLSFPIASDVSIHVTGDATYNRYSDLSFSQGPDTDATGGSGWHFGLRVGLGFEGD